MKRRIVVLVAVSALVAGFMATTGPGVGAATGDTVSEIIAVRADTDPCKSTDAAGNHSGVGVGIAFDGSSLILSCNGSALLSFVSPVDGAFVKSITVSGATSLGALAYDANSELLWACSNSSEVGTIDLASAVYTPVFTSGGCFDGLAYDGTDDTIWASADASSPVSHYDTAGTLLDAFPVDLGGYGNSGLAVGLDVIYLGNNGGSAIYTGPRDLSSTEEFISPAQTGDRRVEDLECDNLTFHAEGVTALWSQDAYDNILTAYEVPFESCFFGGSPPPPPETTTTTTAPAAPPAAPPAPVAPAARAVAVAPQFTG